MKYRKVDQHLGQRTISARQQLARSIAATAILVLAFIPFLASTATAQTDCTSSQLGISVSESPFVVGQAATITLSGIVAGECTAAMSATSVWTLNLPAGLMQDAFFQASGSTSQSFASLPTSAGGGTISADLSYETPEGQIVARSASVGIQVVDNSQTSTATPTVPPTATSATSQTPIATPTPTPDASASPTATTAPAASPTSTTSGILTPIVIGTPAGTATPIPTATPPANASPTATSVPTVAASTATATANPTEAAEVTATATTPSATPEVAVIPTVALLTSTPVPTATPEQTPTPAITIVSEPDPNEGKTALELDPTLAVDEAGRSPLIYLGIGLLAFAIVGGGALAFWDRLRP